MAVELLELAAEATMMAGGEPLPLRAVATAAAAALAGGVAQDKPQAAIYSAITGAAIPYLSKKPVTAGTLAFSIAASTAIGLIAQSVKQDWRQIEEKRKADAARTPMDKWLEGHHR